MFILKNGPFLASFVFFRSFQTNNANFPTDVKISIQYPVLGFKPITS